MGLVNAQHQVKRPNYHRHTRSGYQDDPHDTAPILRLYCKGYTDRGATTSFTNSHLPSAQPSTRKLRARRATNKAAAAMAAPQCGGMPEGRTATTMTAPTRETAIRVLRPAAPSWCFCSRGGPPVRRRLIADRTPPI